MDGQHTVCNAVEYVRVQLQGRYDTVDGYVGDDCHEDRCAQDHEQELSPHFVDDGRDGSLRGSEKDHAHDLIGGFLVERDVAHDILLPEDLDTPFLVSFAVLQYMADDISGSLRVDLALAFIVCDGGEDSCIAPEDSDIHASIFFDVVCDVRCL